MSDTDQSLYTLRYNQVANKIEGFGGGTPQWTPLTLSNPGEVPSSRTISTTAPLTGGGDLSANRTIAITAATGSVNGYLTSADWTTFNGKQASLGTLTAHDVLIGAGGSAVALLSPSTSGFVLTSNGVSADPSFKPSGIGNIVSITGTGTVTPDASAGCTFATTVVGALTLNGPTNPTDGQRIVFRLTQDNVGHTVTFASGSGNFEFINGTSFTASAANGIDYVIAVYNSTAVRWDIVGVSSGVVSSIHADAHANLTGAVQLVSGTNVTLTQSGQAITIAASGGGSSLSTPVYVTANNNTGTTATGDTSFHDTDLTASFTLSSSSNKVKITICGDMQLNSGNWYGIATVFRDSTDLCPVAGNAGGVQILYGGYGTAILTSCSGFVVDAPGDTSAHTYKVSVKVTSSSGTLVFGSNCRHSMLIEEIPA